MKALGYIKVLAMWLGWLFIGTLFYSVQNQLGWAKGFYMAVNVGYSIGWGYPVEMNDHNILFSIVFVLLGASAVAAALSYFAESMIRSSRDWYEHEHSREQLANEKNPVKRFWLWARINQDQLRIIAIWMVWIFCMSLYSCYAIGWSVIQGVYYSVASCSTGGLWAIPHEAPDSAYIWTGFFSACGVPIMALAMANAAQLFMTVGDPEADKNVIHAKVTKKELEMMVKFGLDNGDGCIDRAEFILLCAVRLGALQPQLIQLITDRFNHLDVSKDGSLSYEEILEEAFLKEEFETIEEPAGSLTGGGPHDLESGAPPKRRSTIRKSLLRPTTSSNLIEESTSQSSVFIGDTMDHRNAFLKMTVSSSNVSPTPSVVVSLSAVLPPVSEEADEGDPSDLYQPASTAIAATEATTNELVDSQAPPSSPRLSIIIQSMSQQYAALTSPRPSSNPTTDTCSKYPLYLPPLQPIQHSHDHQHQKHPIKQQAVQSSNSSSSGGSINHNQNTKHSVSATTPRRDTYPSMEAGGGPKVSDINTAGRLKSESSKHTAASKATAAGAVTTSDGEVKGSDELEEDLKHRVVRRKTDMNIVSLLRGSSKNRIIPS